jgi:hypothetical protein
MPTDPGCYEERCRLTDRVALSPAPWPLAPGPLFLALGAFLPLARVIALAVGVVLALPGVTGPASRKIAFRADRAGITLGADLFNLPFRFSAVFVPWADADRIILYPRPGPRWGDRDVRCIGIQRRPGAPALSRRGEPAPGCPVPGVAAGACTAGSTPGGWTASASPPSPRRLHRASPSSTPAPAPTRAWTAGPRRALMRSAWPGEGTISPRASAETAALAPACSCSGPRGHREAGSRVRNAPASARVLIGGRLPRVQPAA